MKNSTYLKSLSVLFFIWTQFSAFAQSDSIQHDGLTRYFKMHFPTGYGTQKSYPLVIALHGGVGSGPQLETQSGLSETADDKGFIVVYPDGVLNPLKIRTWNAGECCGYAADKDIDDVGFIKSLIDTLEARYAIDHNKIFATGMSNGGFMTYRLACELPYIFAAIAPVASTMNTDCTPYRWVPTIHFHSYLDSSIPYAGGRGDGLSDHYNPPIDSVQRVWAESSKCVEFDSTITKDKYDFFRWKNCDCNAEYEIYLSYDGGHSWPNGKKTVIGDDVSKTVFANLWMWDFFEKHPKCEMTPGSFNPETEMKSIIYPNPVRDVLEVSISENIEHIRVSSNGSTIMEFSQIENVVSPLALNVSNLPAGLYIIEIQLHNSIQTHKFIKID